MNEEESTSPLPAWLALSAISIAVFILIYSHL
jgi:hypothetical protein